MLADSSVRPRTGPIRRATLLLALLAAACAGDEGPSGRVQSVLLVTLDTARADVLSGDAASRALAPRIAELADGGVRFPRAYTTAPLTVPAHASILSGLVPPRHGVRDNGLAALPESAETLAEVLRARGFATAAFVSCLVLDRGFGLDQGFELYDQPALAHRTAENFYVERPAIETVRAASAWLERHDPARPFFLWVHLYDAHVPYEPAPGHLARANGDAYRGEIAALDDAVGELAGALERTGLARTTLVALSADHGESLGEHGEPTHGALCYEAAVRVPLVFRFPLAPPLPTQPHVASLVDLYPTLLARLGLPVPGGLDGVDLFAPDVPLDRGVYLESFSGYLNHGWSPLAGWVDARGKYLHSSEPELYSCLQDPQEKKDLARSRPEECARARQHMAELLARPALPRTERAADPDLAAALSALGYARGSSAEGELPSPLEPSDRPSPRSRAGELEPLQRAFTLFEAGRKAECRPIVERLVGENPRHLLALDLYSLCLMEAQEFAVAETVLRRRLAAGPEAADTHLNLGLCRLELGDSEGALPEIEAAARLTPDEPAVKEALERVRAALGR